MEKKEKIGNENDINFNDILEKKSISQNSLKDFEFILNRSKNIGKLVDIKNEVKNLDYIYIREESYSDDILYYLTQLK